MCNFKCCPYRQLQDSKKNPKFVGCSGGGDGMSNDDRTTYSRVTTFESNIYVILFLVCVYIIICAYNIIILFTYISILYAYIYIRYYMITGVSTAEYIYIFTHNPQGGRHDPSSATLQYICYSSNCTHFISVLRLPNLLS